MASTPAIDIVFQLQFLPTSRDEAARAVTKSVAANVVPSISISSANCQQCNTTTDGKGYGAREASLWAWNKGDNMTEREGRKSIVTGGKAIRSGLEVILR